MKTVKRWYKGKSSIRLGDRPVRPGECLEVSPEMAAQLDRDKHLWTKWKPKKNKKKRRGKR